MSGTVSNNKQCQRCGSQFSCSPDKASSCWCMQMDTAVAIPAQYQDCLCKDCLKNFLTSKPGKESGDGKESSSGSKP